jgi:hypothetical protein
MTVLNSAFETSNLLAPRQGNRAMPIDFDFTSVASITGDFGDEQRAAVIENIQSIYIDNSANASTFTIIVLGMNSKGHHVTAQPFTQGWYPLPVTGVLRYQVLTTQGIIIPTIFTNYPMAYFVWGPVPGVLVTPPLTNAPLNFQPLAIGDNVLVAGSLGTTIKTYRFMLSFGGGANVQFFDGPSVNAHPLTGIINMFAGGSITLQVSGVPWFTDAVNTNLVLNSSAGVNCGGMIGYVQS